MVEEPRLDINKLDPETYRHLLQLEALIARRIDPTLYHLIKLRASQINGCAFCLHMHTDQALHHGETPQRIASLDGWHESPLYSEKERAALAWVEEITLIADRHASKEAYDALKPHFSDDEIGWLILAAVQINSWNRIAIASRAQYDPAMFAAPQSAQKTPEPA
ncbi:MAG TPA: carboxymuconolactone decarboxylase family protein [Sphingomicrobium sp.]|jgi:AhpD family alkylhydroperoxidase|nr:carboxymuconolactone decarboxylase family protein [Sphingomicrobium sp.]